MSGFDLSAEILRVNQALGVVPCKHPLYLCEPKEEDGKPILVCPCGHVIRWDSSGRSTMTEVWNNIKIRRMAQQMKERRV